MYARSLQPTMEGLLKEFRIVYLTGPRQAGKTTLVRAIGEELGMEYVTLDDVSVLEAVMADPRGFVRSCDTKPLILDELQYAPQLIPAIKEASDRLEAGRMGRFLLTGSADVFRSARTQEALPGHMARLELYPLSIAEKCGSTTNMVDTLIEGEFSPNVTDMPTREELARLILDGGYPEVQTKSQRARYVWYDSYVEGRLLKDFESLYAARGDYHGKLKALVPYLAGISAGLLKYASVADDLALNDKVIKSYIEILDLMFIVTRLSAYSRSRSKRSIARMEKLHFIDTGLACHLLGLRVESKVLQSPFYGRLLETMMFMECLKHRDWAKHYDTQLHHFRDRRQREVDLVLETSDGKVVGVEVKASATVRREDFHGLKALAEYARDHFNHGVLVYTGEKVLSFSDEGLKLTAVPIGVLLARP